MTNPHGLFDKNPTMDFDRELYDAWITALRGGDYDQCGSALSKRLRCENEGSKQSFCCLGVLVDVAGGGEWNPTGIFPAYTYPEDANAYFGGYYERTSESITRRDVLLSGDAPDYLVFRATGGTMTSGRLIAMNDKFAKTFAEIADAIEENVTAGGFLDEKGEPK